MASTLTSLVTALRDRYPNTLPTDKMTIEEFRYLQGNKEVVDYVIAFLHAHDEELERDELLRDSE